MLKSLLAATTVTLSLVACVKQDDAPTIDRSLPTADQVSIKLPRSNASSRADSEAIGQLSPYYVITLGVTTTFNVGSAWVLTLIHTIVVSQARYNVPLMPLLISTGVAGWFLALRRPAKSSREEPATISAWTSDTSASGVPSATAPAA